MDLHHKPISDIAGLLRNGEITSLALTELMLERIERLNPRLNAFVTITADLAREQARQADEELRNGHDRGALHGIPVAVKDLFATKGIRTTCGSLLFENSVPEQDATVVSRLTESGTVLLGKTGMYELASGTTGLNPFFGSIENPWKSGYDPGGSSGGSASAVAAGLAFAALGTDTGCSVREPAHCCGIVGYKPTFGLVSKAGVQPLAWTLDHVGTLTRTAHDSATILNVIKGFDPTDDYSIDATKIGTASSQSGSLKGKRIGVVRRYFFDCDREIATAVNEALTCLADRGATIVEIDIPDIETAFSAVDTTFIEAAAIYEKELQKQPQKFSDATRRSLEARLTKPAVLYAKAQHFRSGFRSRMESLFEQVDVLAAPTSRHISAPLPNLPDGYSKAVWKNTSIFNFTGHPSISVACGRSLDGLPIGLMLTGSLFGDQDVLQLAVFYQAATNWHQMHPDI